MDPIKVREKINDVIVKKRREKVSDVIITKFGLINLLSSLWNNQSENVNKQQGVRRFAIFW